MNKLNLLLWIIIISVIFYIVFPMEALTQALSMSDKIYIFSREVCDYIKELNLAQESRDSCLEFITKNQENIKQLLEDKNTTEEIKDFAKMIVDKQLHEIKNSWYIFLKHALGIAAISSFIINIVPYSSALWTTFKSLLVPYKAYVLGKELIDKYPPIKEGDIIPIVGHFIAQERKGFYSILDIILYHGIEIVPLEVYIILTFTLTGFLGTTLLPRLVHYLEQLSKGGTRQLPIEELVIILDDMSAVPITASYNVYYSVGIFLVFIIALQLRKIVNWTSIITSIWTTPNLSDKLIQGTPATKKIKLLTQDCEQLYAEFYYQYKQESVESEYHCHTDIIGACMILGGPIDSITCKNVTYIVFVKHENAFEWLWIVQNTANENKKAIETHVEKHTTQNDTNTD
jgi:hypothetical protein